MRNEATVISSGMPNVVKVDRNRSSPLLVRTRVSIKGDDGVSSGMSVGPARCCIRRAKSGLLMASLAARCHAIARISCAFTRQSPKPPGRNRVSSRLRRRLMPPPPCRSCRRLGPRSAAPTGNVAAQHSSSIANACGKVRYPVYVTTWGDPKSEDNRSGSFSDNVHLALAFFLVSSGRSKVLIDWDKFAICSRNTIHESYS